VAPKPRPTDAELAILRVLWTRGPSTVREVHVYEPSSTEHDTLHHLVTDLLDRAFGGSTARLVVQALASKRATPAELKEIRRLLDAAETAKRGTK